MLLWYTIRAVLPSSVGVAWATTTLEIGDSWFEPNRPFHTLAVDIYKMMKVSRVNPGFVITLGGCSRMRGERK